MGRHSQMRGFSLMELLVVVAIIFIVAASAILLTQSTLQNFRTLGDARSLAAALSMARMRAASDFTRSEVCFDTAGGACYAGSPAESTSVLIFNKTSNSYVLEGGSQLLSPGDIFPDKPTLTANGITALPGQGLITQSSALYFNSRGLAVDSTGNPGFTRGGVYICQGTAGPPIACTGKLFVGVYVNLSGQSTPYRWTGAAWSPM